MTFIDNDMLIDIVYTSIVGNEVSWKRNLGNGLYSATIMDNTLNGILKQEFLINKCNKGKELEVLIKEFIDT